MTKKLSWFTVFVVTALGVFWSYQRGADDFRVFHEAWKFVWAGKTSAMYHVEDMPDRFLYAPGFAFFLAPLGLVTKATALAIWNILKVLAMWRLARYFDRRGWIHYFAIALVFWIRPLLIDFQYGQVNFFILVISFFAIQKLFAIENSLKARIIWFWMGFAGLSKVFPLLLFLLPLRFALKNVRTAQRHLAWGIAGAVIPSLIPVVIHGPSVGGLDLLQEWWLALQSRGFPYDSHNQSFAAVLVHCFSSESFRVIPWGPGSHQLGLGWLELSQIAILGSVWTLIIFKSFIWKALKATKFESSWILFGLMFIGSHLVWKPYFLFLIPVTALWVSTIKTTPQKIGFGVLLAFSTLSSTDIVGHAAAGYLECAGLMLWVAVAVMIGASVKVKTTVEIESTEGHQLT